MDELKKLQYMLNIVLNDNKTIDSFVKLALEPQIIGTKKDYHKELGAKRINDYYINHRDNFKEVMTILMNINLELYDLEEFYKNALKNLK